MNLVMRRVGRRIGHFLGAVLRILSSPLMAPKLLAFPYSTQTAVCSGQLLHNYVMVGTERAVSPHFSGCPLAKRDEQRRTFVAGAGWPLANTLFENCR